MRGILCEEEKSQLTFGHTPEPVPIGPIQPVPIGPIQPLPIGPIQPVPIGPIQPVPIGKGTT